MISAVQLIWAADFAIKWHNRHERAQERLAEDVLKFCEPYIPKQTGFLISTGEADGDEGVVSWTAPYARTQYYLPNRRQAGLRGSFWFQRMYEAHQAELVSNAKEAF